MSQRVGLVCGAPVMSAIVTGVVAATMLPGLQFAISVNAAIARSGAAIVHTLTSAVERLVTGDDWAQALRFAAGFRSRSFNNTLLIWVQYQAAFEQGRVPEPFPTYVAGYKQWQQLGRQVSPVEVCRCAPSVPHLRYLIVVAAATPQRR